MPTRSSTAQWSGNLARGSGTMSLGSGAFEGSYSFASRFESGEGTNPEELIAAAHAGCFSMQLAALLSQAGHEPESVQTTADVHLDKDNVKAEGLDEDELQKHAEEAEKTCPVSRALGAIEVSLDAKLA
jgi:osmotically inducible protein OsmC